MIVSLHCAYMTPHQLWFWIGSSPHWEFWVFHWDFQWKMVYQLKLQRSVVWRKVCPLPHRECNCAITATSISDVWIACPSACRRPLSCDCVLFCWYNLLSKVLLFTFLNWSTTEKRRPLRSFTLVTASELWRCFKLSFSVLQNILDKRVCVEVEWEYYWQLYFMQSCKNLLNCHPSANLPTVVLILSMLSVIKSCKIFFLQDLFCPFLELNISLNN